MDYKNLIIPIFLSKDDDLTKANKLNTLITDIVNTAIVATIKENKETIISRQEPIIRQLEKTIVELRQTV